MSEPQLHVAFSPSGALTLRHSLTEQRRTDQVACLHDDFRFGPIGVAWVEAELGEADWDGVVAGTAPFIEASCSTNVLPVAWISRRDARSYAGFLWWLSHLGDSPCKIVDVTDLTVGDDPAKPASKRLAISPSALGRDQISQLLDTGTDLEPSQREKHQARWKELVSENAPLRVVDQKGSLSSAPITYFDRLLLAGATTTWRKMARIVGEAFISMENDGVRQTGDLVPYVRCCVLAETGALEWRGDLSSMQTCELRLPASAHG